MPPLPGNLRPEFTAVEKGIFGVIFGDGLTCFTSRWRQVPAFAGRSGEDFGWYLVLTLDER